MNSWVAFAAFRVRLSQAEQRQPAGSIGGLCETEVYKWSIKAVANPHRQSGQSILLSLLESIDNLIQEHPDTHITITWVPGHMDIEGNEKADMAAKEAANSSNANRYLSWSQPEVTW